MMGVANRRLLHGAALGYSQQVINALERGADPNIIIGRDNRFTVLISAAFKGYAEIVGYLLQFRARSTDVCAHGKTALHYAVSNGRFEVVVKMLAHNVPIDVVTEDNDAISPLGTAVHCGALRMAVLLLDSGADVELRSARGSVLMIAREARDDVMITRIYKAVRRREAFRLREWMIALQTLELPICTCVSF
jgi:ankyrin repeat protein